MHVRIYTRFEKCNGTRDYFIDIYYCGPLTCREVDNLGQVSKQVGPYRMNVYISMDSIGATDSTGAMKDPYYQDIQRLAFCVSNGKTAGASIKWIHEPRFFPESSRDIYALLPSNSI